MSATGARGNGLPFTSINEDKRDDNSSVASSSKYGQEAPQLRFGSRSSPSVSASEVSDFVQGASLPSTDQEKMTAFFDQRKAERMRGAGTHAISQRRIGFPTASSISSSSSSLANTPASAKKTTSLLSGRPTSLLSKPNPHSSSPVISLLNMNQRRNERLRGAATHSIDPRNVNFPTQSPHSSSSLLTSSSKVSKPPISIAELQRRRQERMRGSGKHAIERQQVNFPTQSPASTQRAPSEASSEASASTISHLPTLQTESAEKPLQIPSKTMEKSALAAPSKPVKRKPWRPKPSPEILYPDQNVGAIRTALKELQYDLSTSKIPDLEQRRLERVRGSGTHAIERQQVPFPNPSPANSSVAGSSFLPASSVPSSSNPVRREERRGNVKALQQGRAPIQSPTSSSAVVDKSKLQPTESSFVVPDIEQRKAQRVRGAATHIIEPQRVQFPDQSPGSSVVDRTNIPMSEPSIALPDLEQRRRERIKGAGIHTVQPRTIGFPEQSPASTIQTTLMNDTSQFDNSFLDPALMDASNFEEYQIAQPEDEAILDDDDLTLQQGELQPEEDQTMVEEPSESTPRRKRKRTSEEIAADISRETSTMTDESISSTKLRKLMPPPADLDQSKKRKTRETPLPLWHNPRLYLTNEEKTEAQMQLADIMELCVRKGDANRKTVGPSDADVIYTLIKREFQKIAKTLPKQKRPFLSEILDELVIHFRQLSQQFTTRHQLLKDLRITQEKKLSMRRIVHEQRGLVVEALRSIDGLKQQQERKVFKSKNDRQIASFLTDLRQRYAPLWN